MQALERENLCLRAQLAERASAAAAAEVLEQLAVSRGTSFLAAVGIDQYLRWCSTLLQQGAGGRPEARRNTNLVGYGTPTKSVEYGTEQLVCLA